ncbi:MAG: hypothetical protein ABFS86_16025, partial [Planctomycetota bacterium]
MTDDETLNQTEDGPVERPADAEPAEAETPAGNEADAPVEDATEAPVPARRTPGDPGDLPAPLPDGSFDLRDPAC